MVLPKVISAILQSHYYFGTTWCIESLKPVIKITINIAIQQTQFYSFGLFALVDEMHKCRRKSRQSC